MAKTPSKLVLDLGSKIKQKSGRVKLNFGSGVKLNLGSGATAPVEEWIPETKLARMKVIKLRTAAETQQDGVTKLQQFNPSFFLVGKNVIPCRAPGCNETTPRLKPSGDSQHIKQDLFLCEIHRTKLANLVSKRCEEENIKVNVASFKYEDFHGYTYLIGELEKAFMHLVKKPLTLNMPQNSVYPNSDLVLAEVFLNARNFLTITHALLKPDGFNLLIVLPFLFVMLDEIMNQPTQLELLESPVRVLQEIVNIILDSFGIKYVWVKLNNPGAQIGGGAGLLGGLVTSLSFAFPLGAAIAFGVAGLIAGNLILGGVYQWYYQEDQEDRQNQRDPVMPQEPGQVVPRAEPLRVRAAPMGNLVLDVPRVPPIERAAPMGNLVLDVPRVPPIERAAPMGNLVLRDVPRVPPIEL